MPRQIIALLGIGCLCLTGCGTFSDRMCGPIDDNVYYRGVRLDVQAIQEGGPMTLLAADIPFSAVADTLLIAYYARRANPAPLETSPDAVVSEKSKAEKETAGTVQASWPAE